MTFLAPIAGLVAAAIALPALLLLYFLKKRRQHVMVSTTLLWQKTLRDMEANAPFQRLRRNLLLLLQLLVLFALLFALARPAITQEADGGSRVMIVIDHSASMNATDGDASGRTRLEVAKELALDLVDNLEGDASIVSFAGQARVLRASTREKPPLRDAVRSIEPTDQRTSVGQLVQLIEPFAQTGGESGPLVVHVFSDGRFDSDDTKLEGVDLKYVRVGGAGSATFNLGVVSLSARRDFRDPLVVNVFARLANTSESPVEAHLTLRIDGDTAEVRTVTVPGVDADSEEPGVLPVQFELRMPDAAVIELSHDLADAMFADNRAAIHLLPPQSLTVMLVTRDGRFIEKAIKAARVEKLYTIAPEGFDALRSDDLRTGDWRPDDLDAGIDVIVFDGVSPQTVPPLNSLYFDAAPPIEGLRVGDPPVGSTAPTTLLDWRRDHPLLRHVSLDNIAFGRTSRLALPTRTDVGVDVLVAGSTGPMLVDAVADGRHHLVASFDVVNTNWPMQVSFPVFISNAVQWLGLGGQNEASLSYRTGDVAVVPAPPGASEVEYRGPRTIEATVSQDAAVLAPFSRAGLYVAPRRFDAPWHRLPVNIADLNETDIRPRETLSLSGAGEIVATDRADVRREVWRYFAWAAMIVLGVEWVVYLRRMHV